MKSWNTNKLSGPHSHNYHSDQFVAKGELTMHLKLIYDIALLLKKNYSDKGNSFFGHKENEGLTARTYTKLKG